jgi:transmembrane sensor
MEIIYDLLKKHFLGEATAGEEKQVKRFKKDHPSEYKTLYHLWWSSADIRVKDFDSEAAWLKVLARTNAQKTKTIPLHTKFIRIAAAAAVLVAVSLTVYYLQNTVFHKDIIVSTRQVKEKKEVVLSDGSVIWLNRNSQLSYPETFKGNVRKVSLTGEAYFDVAKNPDKPFVIETTHSEITVLGTSFDVNTDQEKTKVTVTTGKVNVKSLYNNASVNLLPEYTATVTKGNIQKSGLKDLNYMSWKTGKFIFNDTPLKEVVEDLNSFYSKEIIYKNTTKDCRFSASFDHAGLSDIMKILELTCDLKIKENENNYEIQ